MNLKFDLYYQKKCYECHSARAEKIKGGLRLDHIDLILEGGDTGPALVRGNPDDSLMVEAIRYQVGFSRCLQKVNSMTRRSMISKPGSKTEHFGQMSQCPNCHPLKRGLSSVLKRGEKSIGAGNLSFSNPPVAESVENLHPIDQLIREKVAQVGLTPSKPADKRTWLRRVTYDLTGLPPSLSDIENFLSDNSFNSYEIVVNRLLASPHFGRNGRDIGWTWLGMQRHVVTI